MRAPPPNEPPPSEIRIVSDLVSSALDGLTEGSLPMHKIVLMLSLAEQHLQLLDETVNGPVTRGHDQQYPRESRQVA